jgi:hypothetical protein
LRHLTIVLARRRPMSHRGDNRGVPTYRDEVVVLRTHKLGRRTAS